MKKFTKFEKARLIRTAQNVDQYITKKNKLTAKIEAMQAELDQISGLIEVTDAPTKLMTGGFGSEEIIKKIVTPTDKLDKNGNVIKKTSYVFIYDTIIPPVEETTEETTEETPAEDNNETVTPVSEMPQAGSDFDIDVYEELKF